LYNSILIQFIAKFDDAKIIHFPKQILYMQTDFQKKWLSVPVFREERKKNGQALQF